MADKEPIIQRSLTAEEAAAAAGWGHGWSPGQIHLIWRRCMPVGANLDDFELFLYTCNKRGLDPLLKEAYARLQFNSDLGQMQLVIIIGVHGILKLADGTGQLAGLATDYQSDEDGKLTSTTTTMWKKGIEHPFTATAFLAEYANQGKMWRDKPRVMLAKCSTVACARLAFASAIGGLYAEEEFQHEPSPQVAETEDFQVGELPPEEAEEFNREYVPAEIVEDEPPDIPPVIDLPQPEPILAFAVTQPQHTKEEIQSRKETNRALVQRIMTDLNIKTGDRRALLEKYVLGFLGVVELPKDPFLMKNPLDMLDKYALREPQQCRFSMLNEPFELGGRLQETYASTASAASQ